MFEIKANREITQLPTLEPDNIILADKQKVF